MSDVSTPCGDYNRMAPAWALPRALMGGSRAMRESGTAYLPQEAAETLAAYNVRLQRSTLFNGFRKTVRDMAGKVFAKPIVMGDDVPSVLVDYAENIDLTGRNLDTFAFEVFKDALQTGISHILVDMPPAVEGATRADEITSGRRPYLVHVKAEDLIGWRSETVNGVETLTQVRIREWVSEPDGDFGETTVEQIRVLAPGRFRIFRDVSSARTRRAKWEQSEEGATSLQKITLATVYLNRTGFMTAEPPLEDLAEVNLAHWKSQSDQRNILHVARVPILFGSGIPETDTLEIGASRMVRATEANAKLVFVEHTGAAIGAGRTDLKDLEDQMQVLGLELLIPRPGTQTATGRAIDQAAMHAPLAMMANALKDALELALGYMAEYIGLGQDAGGSLTINTDFGVSLRDAADLQALVGALNSGDLSRDTFWAELKRRGVLADGFDVEAEKERLRTEAPALAGEPLPLNDERAAA